LLFHFEVQTALPGGTAQRRVPTTIDAACTSKRKSALFLAAGRLTSFAICDNITIMIGLMIYMTGPRTISIASPCGYQTVAFAR